MKKLFFLFFLAVAQVSFCLTDEIVVRVNDEVITRSEIASISGEPEQVIDVMINQILLTQEARKFFSVTKKEIDERLARVKGDFGKEEEFYAALSLQGIDESFLRKKIEEEILKQRLVSSLREKIAVPEERLVEELSLYSEEMQVSYLVFEKKEDADNNFLALKQKGTTTSLIKEIDFFCAPEMREEFSKICFALEEGQISHPTLIDGKFYIIICKKRQPTSIESLQRIREEFLLDSGRQDLEKPQERERILDDILELIEERIKKEKLNERISRLIEGLRPQRQKLRRRKR
ncbi:MAG: hypothetical protein QME07_05415, partial [bacterium]|nr:hypothetical protein [bacterium]